MRGIIAALPITFRNNQEPRGHFSGNLGLLLNFQELFGLMLRQITQKILRGIRKFFTLQQLATLLYGLVLGLIPNIIAEPDKWVWITLIFFVFACGVQTLAWVLSPYTAIATSIVAATAIRRPEDVDLHPRKGFIGFVSMFNNPAKLSDDDLENALQSCDFNTLQLNHDNSNFRPLIKAIKTYGSQLKHCWLIATEGEQSRGSAIYLDALVALLQQQVPNCTFHCKSSYTVLLDNDTEVLKRTYDLFVKRIFKDADKYGLTPQDIIADCTGGFRSLTLGMILSCLDKERDIQFIGTKYDEQGRPDRDVLTPIIFSFFPETQSNGG